MWFRTPSEPEARGPDSRPLDPATAAQLNLQKYFPRWMPEMYHTVQILGVLRSFTSVPVTLAPLLPVDCWAVVNPNPECIDTLFSTEGSLGRSEDRIRYTWEGVERARDTRTAQLRSFRGSSDLAVPIVRDGHCDAVLVAGPFVAEPLSAERIVAQWIELHKGPSHPYDPRLIAYARSLLGLQVLDAREVEALRELLETLARAYVGSAELPRELDRVAELREQVFGRTCQGRAWKADQMTSPIGNIAWAKGELNSWDRAELGIEKFPNTVIAIAPREADTTPRDPVTDLVAMKDFQEGCLRLCGDFADTLASHLEDYGVRFLFHVPLKATTEASSVAALERARKLASAVERRLGIRVAVGVGGTVRHASELPECARRAAFALQMAAYERSASVSYDAAMEQRSGSTPAATPAHALGRLAKLFTLGLFADLASLEADYVNAVLWEAGGRMARIRLHFEYAIDVLVDALATGAEIEPATTRDLRQTVVDSLQRAASAQALARALRDALRSFTRITRTPRRSDLELRLARAARTIETQCSEPLTLATVARSVGLSANYFSERFKATHKVGFTAYLSRARVERAKYLLCNSPAAICRVSEECGFLSVPHFNRVFKSALGLTPSQFRERTGARHKSVA